MSATTEQVSIYWVGRYSSGQTPAIDRSGTRPVVTLPLQPTLGVNGVSNLGPAADLFQRPDTRHAPVTLALG